MTFLKLLLIVVVSVCAIVACNQTEWYQDFERGKAAAIADRAVPRIVSKTDDGCAVYSFYTDTTHYFTRCGSATSTDRTYSVPAGKMQNRKTESITTESHP